MHRQSFGFTSRPRQPLVTYIMLPRRCQIYSQSLVSYRQARPAFLEEEERQFEENGECTLKFFCFMATVHARIVTPRQMKNFHYRYFKKTEVIYEANTFYTTILTNKEETRIIIHDN